MLYPIVRSALFALDPERAHRLTLEALQTAGRLPQRQLPGRPVELMGLRFPNRVGLAAGFDKNGVAVDGIGRLGFGFIEVGTVTPRPQCGQAPPRLFRLPARAALINRLGFPNDGAKAIAARLKTRRYRGVLGVNIGKNADTPIDRAVDDYLSCLRTLHRVADYFAINISSPNTQALRDLHEPSKLEPLLGTLLAERDRLRQKTQRPLPLVLKISPDLNASELRQVAAIARRVSLDGLIAVNTTVRRPGESAADGSRGGGLSGAPLHLLALETVRTLRQELGPEFPIVGVGGIDSAAKAQAMRAAGADLVQIYTGLIYRGPGLIAQCAKA